MIAGAQVKLKLEIGKSEIRNGEGSLNKEEAKIRELNRRNQRNQRPTMPEIE
jgi:hypothetical protein